MLCRQSQKKRSPDQTLTILKTNLKHDRVANQTSQGFYKRQDIFNADQRQNKLGALSSVQSRRNMNEIKEVQRDKRNLVLSKSGISFREKSEANFIYLSSIDKARLTYGSYFNIRPVSKYLPQLDRSEHRDCLPSVSIPLNIPQHSALSLKASVNASS